LHARLLPDFRSCGSPLWLKPAAIGILLKLTSQVYSIFIIGSISSGVSELTFIHRRDEHSPTGKLETSDHAPLDFLFKTTGEELYDTPVAAANPFCSKPCCTIQLKLRLHV
jgi:hypothetical protein